MSFQDIVQAAQKYFPDLQIKYKDQSSFMKLLGTIMFFNTLFMTSYATTFGSSIYFPNANYIRLRPYSSAVVLLHELVHVYDSKKINKFLFSFLYMSPITFVLLCIPLFLISWKIALPLMLLCLSPVPSYFRMYFEKRAYLSSLYVIKAMGTRLNFDPALPKQSNYFLSQFKGPYYYFMWPFSNLDQEFSQAIDKVNAGQRPYEDPVFDMLDDLVSKA